MDTAIALLILGLTLGLIGIVGARVSNRKKKQKREEAEQYEANLRETRRLDREANELAWRHTRMQPNPVQQAVLRKIEKDTRPRAGDQPRRDDSSTTPDDSTLRMTSAPYLYTPSTADTSCDTSSYSSSDTSSSSCDGGSSYD